MILKSETQPKQISQMLVAFFFFCMGLGSGIANAIQSQEEEDFAIEDVIVEEWKGIDDSIKTMDLKLKTFRYQFGSKGKFDLEKFETEITKACKDKKLPAFFNTLFSRYYPDASSPNQKGFVWGHRIRVATNRDRTRVEWETNKGEEFLNYLFTPFGFVSKNTTLRQVVISASGSYESFAPDDILLVPYFKSGDQIVAKESDEGFLIQSKDKKYELKTDASFFVESMKTNKTNSTYVRKNIMPMELSSLGFKVPRLYFEIRYDQSNHPKYLVINQIESIKVNSKLPFDSIALGCEKDTRIIDKRNGDRNVRFYRMSREYKDVMATVEQFLRKKAAKQQKVDSEKPNTKPSAAKPAVEKKGSSQERTQKRNADKQNGNDQEGDQLDAKSTKTSESKDFEDQANIQKPVSSKSQTFDVAQKEVSSQSIKNSVNVALANSNVPPETLKTSITFFERHSIWIVVLLVCFFFSLQETHNGAIRQKT